MIFFRTRGAGMLAMLLFFSPLSATAKLDAVNKVCSVAMQDAAEALIAWNMRTPPNGNLRELSREIHAQLMRVQRERVFGIYEEIKRGDGVDTSSLAMDMLGFTSRNYRFALCQREKRPKAAIKTIQSEAYDRCLSIVQKEISENHQLCF